MVRRKTLSPNLSVPGCYLLGHGLARRRLLDLLLQDFHLLFDSFDRVQRLAGFLHLFLQRVDLLLQDCDFQLAFCAGLFRAPADVRPRCAPVVFPTQAASRPRAAWPSRLSHAHGWSGRAGGGCRPAVLSARRSSGLISALHRDDLLGQAEPLAMASALERPAARWSGGRSGAASRRRTPAWR